MIERARTGRALVAPRHVASALVAAVLVATGAAIAPVALGAQEPPRPAAMPAPPPDSLGLEPGRRVRVQFVTYRDRIAGVIDSVLPSAFVLDTAARASSLPFMARGPELLAPYRTMRVGYDEIELLEVSRGTSRARGALLWGAVGGAAGALLGGLNRTSGAFVEDTDDESFASRALPGAIVGAVLGGAFGWFTGRERWAPVGWP